MTKDVRIAKWCDSILIIAQVRKEGGTSLPRCSTFSLRATKPKKSIVLNALSMG